MLEVFEIYLYICGIIISVALLIGVIVLLLNLIVYFYETYISFDTFKKFLRKYHNEMKKEKVIKANAEVAFNSKED